MSSCFELVDDYTEKFRQILSKDSQLLPVHEYPWRSDTWRNETFARGHVQLFANHAIRVLHVTVFPHLDDGSPIYGFDVITGERKPSSCYMDLSPSIQTWDNWPEWYDLNEKFPNRKAVPEWGTCFSKEFMAIALEDEAELERALSAGIEVLGFYLAAIHVNRMLGKFQFREAVYAAQESYCAQQRKNTKTSLILERMIGTEQSNYYVNNVLFPNPKD